ncbi:nucleoside deaminase [Arthrobacter castelli]|uniref:nucleoside deaminase n=1 Tax=Arthrobacter castelli TaxID=271431 RepID=UPI0006867465|nr:nucleoside deaminase [Arthrobacter castelli]
MDEQDLKHLAAAVELAREGLEAGDEPFGSVLVTGDDEVLRQDRNRVAAGDNTRHPELALAQWAANNMSGDARALATVYTSGEHCPMCSAAHGWVGLGRIVYASSSRQLSGWLAEWGAPPSPVRPLPVQEVAPRVAVEGPEPELAEEVRKLQMEMWRRRGLPIGGPGTTT